MVLNAASDGFSDLRLVLAMERLAAGGGLGYTDHQLHYAVSRKKTRRKGVLKRLTGGNGHPPYQTTTMPYPRFRASLDKWLGAGGWAPGRLLFVDQMGSDPNRRRLANAELSPEFTAHGFDRAVVTEDAATAVMLVANNFHVDHRCAVFSEDGYPEAFRAELLALLNQNPALVVAVVHSASTRGLSMVHRLRSWFPRARLIEVGLRPDQVKRGNLYAERDPAVRAADPVTLSDTNLARLDDWERDWLAWGLSTPLAVLGPTKLMRLLSRAFANAARLDEQHFADPTTRAPGFDDASHLAPTDDDTRQRRAGERSRFRNDAGYHDDHVGTGIWYWDVGGGDDLFDGDDFDGDG